MTYSIMKFCCSLCHSEYKEELAAAGCEALGRPEPKFKVGDEISYMVEEPCGSRWVTFGSSGKVVGRRLIWVSIVGNTGRHMWLYAVEEEDPGVGVIVAGVVDGPEGLHSPVEIRRIRMDETFEKEGAKP